MLAPVYTESIAWQLMACLQLPSCTRCCCSRQYCGPNWCTPERRAASHRFTGVTLEPGLQHWLFAVIL